MRSIITLVLALILLTVALGTHARALDGLEWTWHNPLPQGNHLTTLVDSGDFILAAGFQGTVLRSEDGRNWEPVDVGTRMPIYGGAFGGGTTKLVGPGIVLSSDDGIGWTTVLSEEVRFVRDAGLAFGDGVWIAGYVSYDEAEGNRVVEIQRSGHGNEWETVELDLTLANPDSYIADVVYGGSGRFLVVGSDRDESVMLLSADSGETWESVSGKPSFPIEAAFWNGESFAVVGGSGKIAFSEDASDWMERDVEGASVLFNVSYLSNQWVVGGWPVGGGGDWNWFVSQDGEEWSMIGLDREIMLTSTVFFQGEYIAAGEAGTLLNGAQLSEMAGPEIATTMPLSDIAFNGDVYVAVGGGLRWPDEFLDQPFSPTGRILMSSPDLDQWTVHHTDGEEPLFGVAYGNGAFVAVGGNGTVLTSEDGVEWSEQDAGTSGDINAVVFGEDVFVAVGDDGYLAISANGIDWENLPVPWDPTSGSMAGDIRDIAYGDGRFVAMASYGPFGSELRNSNHFIHASDPFSWNFSWIPHPPMDETMFPSQASLARIT